MRQTIDPTKWAAFLREYSSKHEGRPTRLGVIETNHAVAIDYWIEDGLPLIALDVYENNGKTRVDILFNNYTHPIDDTATLVLIDGDGTEDGLDIVDADGVTAVLRFENWKVDED